MISNDLPVSWLPVLLNDVGEVVTGKTPSTKSPNNFGGDIPFIKPADLDNSGYITRTAETLTDLGASAVPTVPANSILVTCIGNLGKVGITNRTSATNQQINTLVSSSLVEHRFFYYQLQTLKPWMRENASATTVTIINKGKFSKAPVALAPLAEQKAIADKLDTLLAQVENTKARLERIPQILKRFRQSVLAAAVSGRLTEEWRGQNSVSITDWDALTVGDVATVATGKTPSRKEPKYWKDGDVPWLTSASTGAIYTELAEQFVTKRAVDEYSLKVFPPGTLLLAMYGEGKTRGQVTELRLSATCNQACASVTADERKILRSYLKLRLLENYEETRKAAAGGAQPNLNLNKVRAISISVPDKEEQTEIVRRVDQLFAHADRIEQQVNNALARVNNLTQSILTKAFRGELTEQWRKDNPELISGENSAEALLERIKAERAAQKPAGRRTKNRKSEQAAK
ncbi:restriction endonuclease subunit S [Marinobacter manganoxydans]|uniref:Restriction modification system DNA specificity domain-containing protein n=1 Tax=Marinobacter manganoxydans MnI7-9 TaxID=1094979 RepID=G6YYU7_9GAMM|nr:restriction endonuclease subunit S [Marinobacter manganoxydans]EHJ02489.1 restriction modification system DNA specificity domain-containing protein [Marinobacter manganoxydans MnI7-9]